MAFESLTDDKIADLINCSKLLKNPNAKSKNNNGCLLINYKVIALDESGYEFEVYKRQNTREGMNDDYSCGISWLAPNGESLTLRRYNGLSHNHPNHLEKEKTGFSCHIHVATEKYMKANRKPEGYAKATNRYKTVDGALHCLVTDCKISGIQTQPDDTQISLFEK